MNDVQDSGFLAPSDVAELAGVSRAAVSNWRKRELGFPEPVAGTKANPLFDRTDVERWLKNRRPQQPRADRVSGGLALWSLINGYRGDMSVPDMQALALSVLCARKLTAGSDDEHLLRREAAKGRFLEAVDDLAAAPGADDRWRQLVWLEPESLRGRGVDRLTTDLYGLVAVMAIGELARAADFVINRVIARQGRTTGEHGAVKSPVSRLLAEVASAADNPAPTIAYDPACGIGETLIEFWRRSRHRDQVHLYGTEIDPDYARICRQRCFLHGATATVECGDVLVQEPLPDIIADVVMAEPPFGLEMPAGFSLTDPRWALAGLPPKGDAASAWIQHVVAHLADSGRGFIVTSRNATTGPGSVGIRRVLVQRGCVDAVVALPRKLLSYTPIQTTLWVLRPPDRPGFANEVLFVDASSLDPGKPLDLSILATRDWADGNPDTHTAFVESADILADEQVRLAPQYWAAATVDPGEVAGRFRDAAGVLEDALGSITHTAYSFTAVPPATTTVTIRDLERQGALSIARGLSPARPHGENRVAAQTDSRIEDAGLREEGPPYRLATRQIVRDGLPAGAPEQWVAGPAAPTGPGDILAVSGHAVVDEIGGWVPGPGVSRITVDDRQLDPHYVAECMNGKWNQRAEATPSAATQLRELEIPLIALEDQRRLATEFRQARQLARSGRDLAAAADDLVSVRLDAIRHGVELSGASGIIRVLHETPSPSSD